MEQQLVKQQSIELYRKLLASIERYRRLLDKSTDEAQRREIFQLLSDQQRRVRTDQIRLLLADRTAEINSWFDFPTSPQSLTTDYLQQANSRNSS
jgi:hypothetical protein